MAHYDPDEIGLLDKAKVAAAVVVVLVTYGAIQAGSFVKEVVQEVAFYVKTKRKTFAA